MSDLLTQHIPLERQKQHEQQELYRKLTETLDQSLGLDDASLKRDGYGELLDNTRRLKVYVGEDYGHMVALEVDAADATVEQDTFFLINTVDDGTLQVIAARKSTQSHLVNVDESGRILEGFPTDEVDIFKRKAGSGKLSSEDARKLVEDVMGEFGSEYDRRLLLLPHAANEED